MRLWSNARNGSVLPMLPRAKSPDTARRSAIRTRSASDGARILCITLPRWDLTVFSDVPSSDAIRLFGLPVTTSVSDSHHETGSSNSNVAPLSEFLLSARCPPCASTIDRLIDRPTPIPSGLVVKNGVKMRRTLYSLSPGPES